MADRDRSKDGVFFIVEANDVGNYIAELEKLGNAIGSTEPTVEDRVHWTPEMREMAARDEKALALFHQHLDRCSHCNRHTFNLCLVGATYLSQAAKLASLGG